MNVQRNIIILLCSREMNFIWDGETYLHYCNFYHVYVYIRMMYTRKSSFKKFVCICVTLRRFSCSNTYIHDYCLHLYTLKENVFGEKETSALTHTHIQNRRNQWHNMKIYQDVLIRILGEIFKFFTFSPLTKATTCCFFTYPYVIYVLYAHTCIIWPKIENFCWITNS